MNQAQFKVIFKEKYMFERLKQTGEMTIAEYETASTNLTEYAPHLIATDEMRA